MLFRQATTSKNDMWALGITLVELLAGKYLWVNGDNEPEMIAKIAGLLGLKGGFPYEAYKASEFDFKLHLHPSGFPVRTCEHSNELEVLRPIGFSEESSSSNCGTSSSNSSSLSASSEALKRYLGMEVDELLVDFVASLLQIDPKCRPTPKEALQHKFLQQT
eukprot:4491982-Pyramimonas_sp.AAC.1